VERWQLPSQVNAYSSNLVIMNIAKAHYPNLSLVYFLPFMTGICQPRRMLQEPSAISSGSASSTS
jgi:hypothetical protein